MTHYEFDITAVINVHREGYIALPALRSVLANVERAKVAGLRVETIIILDNPDDLTRNLMTSNRFENMRCIETPHADLGMARNTAVSLALGEDIAFLDGDDLWSRSWLLNARAFLLKQDRPEQSILHPSFNYMFGALGQSPVFFHIPSNSPNFSPDSLRTENNWTALSYARKSTYLEFPYEANRTVEGWGYEDWNWNMRTLAAGFEHLIVPETCHFIRQKARSMVREMGANQCWVLPTDISRYDWPGYQQAET